MGHVWLIGMMASGKTTVGVLAAEILARPFLDTDAVVMQESGRTIAELFEESEQVFRDHESAVIATAAADPIAVIATGGGSIMSRDNVGVMEASGVIVLLDVDAATVADRVAGSEHRPLIDGTDSIEQILAERREAYNTVAQYVVSTLGRDPQEIAMEVASCVDM